MAAESDSPPPSVPGRWWALLGVGLAVGGVAAYATQVAMHRLTMPWYLPLTATLGALAIVVSLWQRRGVGRAIALGLVLLLAVGEWGFVLGTRLPAYSGPVAIGKPFPHFSTTRADGTSFTQNDLAGQDTALVFFRGRW
ncbi:MAG TPA: hypothetical protein VG125_32145 [Pirellulales bacterium]|jgi:hypothetical protein|nr:hypothetical protein [Pirellulales bacterium]